MNYSVLWLNNCPVRSINNEIESLTNLNFDENFKSFTGTCSFDIPAFIKSTFHDNSVY